MQSENAFAKINFHFPQSEKRESADMDSDVRQPDPKRVKTEFCSDNSVSLPGIQVSGSSGPVGFEPGMFKNDDESSSHSRSKSKDKEKSGDGVSKVLHLNSNDLCQ